MSVFGVARARTGRKKNGCGEERSDRAVGLPSSSWWRFFVLGSPLASVFAGFGNAGEKFGAIRFRGASTKLALIGSFFRFGPCSLCRLTFRTACVCVLLGSARFLGGEGRLTYGRLFSGEPRFWWV